MSSLAQQPSNECHVKRVSTDTNKHSVAFAEGDTVYHKNPIGLNYVYKGKRGKISGFVNTTKKRAVVTWSTGQVKKHNVSSLAYSLPEESSTPYKKRKRDDAGPEPNKHRDIDNSLMRQNSGESDYINSSVDNTCSSDGDSDDEWVTKLLLKI